MKEKGPYMKGRKGKEGKGTTRTGTERQVRNGKATQWKDNGKERKGKGNERNGKHGKGREREWTGTTRNDKNGNGRERQGK